MNKIYFSLILLLIIYLILISFLYFFQRNLLYHPTENNYYGDELKVSVEKIKIKTKDSLELISWFHKKNIRYKTILFLHGNAGTLENRIHKINHFKDMKVNFLILAWRGFSGNKGKPTEKGLYEDANSAIKWLKTKGFYENDIIIYGESLGTGVTVEIAQNKNFAGIILESPFTSMTEAAKNKYPFFPIELLLKDKYENYKKIKNITSPVLIMHGEKDSLVPFFMGKKIYQLANDPKYSYFSKYDDHMMEFNEKLVEQLKKFISSLN
ncbi:alpha/beta hydrolase [Candidatus Pelagibacter sp.]|nr:alpha/beta hydrolase [Candidatus Pelagibacter sp.]